MILKRVRNVLRRSTNGRVENVSEYGTMRNVGSEN